jgi:zinc protease
MNAVLGGLFGSRLNLSLREKHAFTYGASSGFDWRRDAGPFGASAAVKSEVTAQAVTEILREIDQLRAVPPTGTEVSLATEYLAGVFPIRFETTAAVAGAIAGAITHGLSEDWFARYRERILHVDTRSVHAAARAHLDPDRLLVLAVGDGELLEAPLRALACGPMQVRDSSNDEDADV